MKPGGYFDIVKNGYSNESNASLYNEGRRNTEGSGLAIACLLYTSRCV